MEVTNNSQQTDCRHCERPLTRRKCCAPKLLSLILKYSFNITVNLLDVSNTKRFEGRIDVLNVYDSYNSNMQARVRDGSSFIFY